MAQIDPAQQGKLAGPLNGQSTLHDPQGSRALKEPVHAFGAPVMLLDTPSSAALTSQTQVLAYAGEGLGFVSQGDVQHSAAHTASQVSGQTTSFFTHAGGLQAKAANGPLSLRAHTDALQILASKEVQILSVNDEITISAKNKIELIGGDSGLTLEGGDITFTTPGTWAVKGASHGFGGGASNSAMLPGLPNAKIELPVSPEFGVELDVGSFFQNDPQLEGASYEVWTRGDTPVLLGRGSIDAIGRSGLVSSPTPIPVDIFVGDNEWFDIEDIQIGGEAA
jgi:type VI secretion system secreted protein VgrG